MDGPLADTMQGLQFLLPDGLRGDKASWDGGGVRQPRRMTPASLESFFCNFA